MTVEELIKELKVHPRKMEVHFSYNYGDHWHTIVAPKVETVEELCVEHSGYHDMPKVVDEDKAEAGDPKQTLVLVLST